MYACVCTYICMCAYGKIIKELIVNLRGTEEDKGGSEGEGKMM